MAREIPTEIPTNHMAGDTLEFKRYYEDFDPATWTVNFFLLDSSAQISFSGSDNGDYYHLFDVAASTTASWSPSIYKFRAVADDGTDRFQVEEGSIEVAVNFETETSGYDTRSHVKKTLDALEATILGRASKDQSSYSIAGRSLSRMSPDELLRWHDKYSSLYKAELAQERIESGLASGYKILTRMPA